MLVAGLLAAALADGGSFLISGSEAHGKISKNRV